MSDKELVSSILNGGRDFELAAGHLLTSNYGLMYDLKEKFKLESNDVKDLYADAVAHLIWNIKTSKFKGESKVSTYLYKILSNKSVDFIRHSSTNKNKPTIDISDLQIEDPFHVEENVYTNIAFEKMKIEIENMGVPCNGIIMDWAYYGYSMSDIAERNNIENAEKAKNKNIIACKN